MKSIRNINPLGYVDVPVLGRQGPAFDADGEPTEAGTGCLIPDEVLEVSDEVAGEPPTYDEEGRVVDLGSGLLAQVGNFEPADGREPSTVAEVLKHVGTDRGRAQAALDREQAKSTPRSTLVAALQELLDDNTDESQED